MIFIIIITIIIARRRIYQVTSVSCFYGRHTNFNFTYLYFKQLFDLLMQRFPVCKYKPEV